jgi:hypothetical protein
MKRGTKKDRKEKASAVREQILKSMVASFKIEGITIPDDLASLTLKEIEISLGK